MKGIDPPSGEDDNANRAKPPIDLRSPAAAPSGRKTVSILNHDEDPAGLLQQYVTGSQSFKLHFCYATVAEALTGIVTAPPDLALVNLGTQNKAAEFTQRLKRLRPRVTIVIAADQADLCSWVRAFQAGADGFFVKPGTQKSFENLLHNSLADWKPFSVEIQKLLVGRIAHIGILAGYAGELSPAEREVMALMMMGYHDKEIAILRNTSEGTAHSIKNSLYKKLKVHKRGDAVRACYLPQKNSFA